MCHDKIWKVLKGDISYDEYRSRFLTSTGLAEEVSGLFDQVCLTMFEQPYEYTERMLSKVSNSCRVFLLSDHCDVWVDHIVNGHTFFSCFEDIVWSFEIGATKRESKPFTTIIERNDLIADESLFVDDTLRNIIMADSMGMKTVHFEGSESVDKVYRAIEIG